MTDYEKMKANLETERARIEALRFQLQTMRELHLHDGRKDTKIKLKETKENIEKQLKRVKVATTFPIHDFFPFLLKFLEGIEQKEMEMASLVQDYNQEKIKSNKIEEKSETLISKHQKLKCMLLPTIDEYFVIVSMEEMEKIKSLLNDYSLLTAIEKAKIEKYFLLPADIETITLANGIELNKEFSKFPELQFVLERLIELEWQENIPPEETDLSLEEKEKRRRELNQKRLESILEEMVENKETIYSRIRKHSKIEI